MLAAAEESVLCVAVSGARSHSRQHHHYTGTTTHHHHHIHTNNNNTTTTHNHHHHYTHNTPDYTRGLAKEAVRILFKYLPAAYENGERDLKAREKVHYAATIAGMSFANAFLGVCHSMAHKLGARFHVAHGLANAGEGRLWGWWWWRGGLGVGEGGREG